MTVAAGNPMKVTVLCDSCTLLSFPNELHHSRHGLAEQLLLSARRVRLRRARKHFPVTKDYSRSTQAIHALQATQATEIESRRAGRCFTQCPC